MKPTKEIELPRALITGFAAFGGETINPSLEIVRALDKQVIAAHHVVGAELPTEFAASVAVLDALIQKHSPQLVIAIGQAGGRSEICLERVAINLIDARIPDNAGAQPIDVPVVENAPAAYFSTLPLKAMLARLRGAGIPASLSHTAGTFVCNQVFFALAHLLAERHRNIRGGFVHVPYLPQQAARFADAPSMPLEMLITALRICLETALTTRTDMHYAAGATH